MLQRLNRGTKDLARRDLRDEIFDELQLFGVDLTGAHVERSSFRGANLSEATLMEAQTLATNFENANLNKLKARASVFVGVRFAGATVTEAEFEYSHFTQSVFKGANLKGANFREARFRDGTDFSDAIIDETTMFDGSHILRQLAAQDAFRYYDVERGVLVRRKDGPRALQAEQPRRDSKLIEAERRIKELLNTLAPLTQTETAGPQIGMGHNNPPEPTPLERPEFVELTETLSTLAVELHREDIRQGIITAGVEKVDRASSKVAAWVARKADMAADECAKQLGKSLADARVWMAGWLMISGKLTAIVELLVGLVPH